MPDKTNPSANKMWQAFIKKNKGFHLTPTPPSWCFCDNKKDANECAELVVKKIKQATCSSLTWFEKENEKLPEKGDLDIITTWNGEAIAIIETTEVEQITYKNISKEFAKAEGEGDKSLEYWKKVHWAFFTRELTQYGELPSEDMLLITQKFKTIHP